MTVGTTKKSACPFHQDGHPDEFCLRREYPLDPPGQVRQLRAAARISKVRLWDGSEAWVATHYDDVREILGDPRFSTVTSREGYPFVTQQRRDVLLHGRPNFTFMDAPEHTKFRRMLARLFTLERFERLRPFMQETVDLLLDELAAVGPRVDFIEKFAIRLPLRVLSKVVGVPFESEALFIEAASTRVDLGADPALSHRSGEVLWRYLDDLIAERENNTGDGDDVITHLVIEQIRPGKITREEAVLIVNQLLIAGYDNTANAIAMGTLALLQNLDQFDLLCREPALVPAAVNEVLRYATTPQFHASRAAKEDIKVGGQIIRKGEGVIALLHGANRDPVEFADPDRFDIRRDAAHHLSFSYGMHQCLGQSLARLELQLVFKALAERFPSLRLAVPIDEIPFAALGLAYGPTALPVEW